MVSEGGLVHIGIYKVIFGRRIRCGFMNDKWGVSLDWCAGPDEEKANQLYQMALAILGKRPEDGRCFDGIPTMSQIKPVFNDSDFMARLISLIAVNVREAQQTPLENEVLIIDEETS